MTHDHRMNPIGDNYSTGMRTKHYGWAGESTKGIGQTVDIKDDPGYTPVEVGSTPATPQKGYFPVVSKEKIGEVSIYDNDKKRTRFGATRQAKKNLKAGY